MTPAYDFNGVTLYQGDSAEVLKALPDASVHCCITSPPYFNLRSYLPADHADKGREIGLEASPAAHLEALLRVFRECCRVLRPDGVMAVNYGDSYTTAGTRQGNRDGNIGAYSEARHYSFPNTTGLPDKNLLGMPWRLAFALQAEGWILRSALPFFKVTAMPESCRDRPTTAHEYVFLFVKRARYWYDADAVRLPHADYERGNNPIESRGHSGRSGGLSFGRMQAMQGVDSDGAKRVYNPAGRNFRTSDVYPLALADQLEAVDAELERLTLLRCHMEKLTTARGLLTDPDGEPLALNLVSEPTKESHFAAFGTNLVKPLLLSGCPETVCAKCGAGYVREVLAESRPNQDIHSAKCDGGYYRRGGVGNDRRKRELLGFSPSCTCNVSTAPGVVLDPFAGTGTVAYVARALGRKAVGIELSSEYLDIARRRLGQGSLFLTDGEEEEGT